ncbi:hypothetical protein ABFV05_015332 [Capra hircus]
MSGKDALGPHLVPGSLSWFLSFSPSLHLPLSFFYLFSVYIGRDNMCEKTSYMFLQKELPVCLNWYMQSFLELLEYANKSPEDPQVLDNFLQVLIKVRNKHNDVAPTMAQGVIEYKEKFGFDPFINSNTQYFLDRFHTNCNSFHVLINQHTLLFGGDTNPAYLKHIGNIDPTCNVTGVVKDVYGTAKMLCEPYYLVAPELEVEEFSAKAPNTSNQVVYVPSHLFLVLFELFKNSTRTTVKPYEDRKEAGPLAGFGYDLPISCLYARYFQGDLKCYSMEGALSSEAFERLPAFNKSTWRHYKSTAEADDWSSPSSEPRDASKYKAKQDKMKAHRTL